MVRHDLKILQKIYLLDALNFADVSLLFFFFKKSVFFGKNSTFTQSNSMTAVLEIFEFYFQFL